MYQHKYCGVLEEEKREKGTERLYEETMAKSFPDLTKDMNTNSQETQIPNRMKQIPNRMNSETHTETHYNQIAKS